MTKSNTEAMKDSIGDFFAGFGVKFQFDPDQDLAVLKKGRRLLAKEVRAMPDGSIIYVTYKEHGDRGFRVNGAHRINRLPEPENDPDTWSLSDGSGFGAELCLAGVPDEADAYDEIPEGDMYCYQAVPKRKA